MNIKRIGQIVIIVFSILNVSSCFPYVPIYFGPPRFLDLSELDQLYLSGKSLDEVMPDFKVVSAKETKIVNGGTRFEISAHEWNELFGFQEWNDSTFASILKDMNMKGKRVPINNREEKDSYFNVYDLLRFQKSVRSTLDFVIIYKEGYLQFSLSNHSSLVFYPFPPDYYPRLLTFFAHAHPA